ncbi:histidine kinase [Caballeronia mineralivorans PML1(12)]|uniref:histidine kinase n=1 Tax=Caballeronia mineralivorans PML1(12) TaxID=908627 RepID=A0A0J1CTA4_9BURK|nr:PAS domain-containing sensor histidine kinase [Caballeronia mineralivorans]KLU23880.1 histidine kinase [Caballeronia mineralivorans PML1(12)]
MKAEDSGRSRNLSDEQRFQLLVTGVSDYAIYMLNPEGFINSWNAGAERFKGYVAEEIIGQHFSVFYTEEDRRNGKPARALQTAREQGKFEDEGWRVRKDGTRFWANVVVDPIRDHSGELIGFAKITRDITERKAAEEALRESEERFRLLVQGVTDYAIYMISPTGEITNWNAGAERIKGYKREEIVGSNFAVFYTEEDRARGMPAQTLKTASEEGRFEQESWRVRRDGTRFWAHVVVDAIHDDEGKLLGFAKVTRDISERKQAAEALERANAALFQSQKMEAIGQLTGGIAHDFNNLLAVMLSSVDVLATRAQNYADIKVLDAMRRAVERGALLTQQLLSFARRQPLMVERYDLNKVIGSFEAVLRRAGNSAIEMDIRPAHDTRTVLLDAARFEAALLNLVVNARDAMPDGGKLVVAVENVELGAGQVGNLVPGAYVRVSVADTGSGMPPAVAARAFEPFFTTKEVGKGTGLGLSQVYGFIAQSGGDVTIDSEEGKGTTISMYLPVVEGEPDDVIAVAGARVDTVLIVEDEPDVLDAAGQLFRSIGYEVVTATNGVDAMAMLERRTDIDILFTDVVMPKGMNGIQLVRSARELRPDLKVILASGYPLSALREQYGRIDDFAFVNKPYRLAELAKVLRAAG